MAIIVVGGSGKDIGKTALVCAVISELSDFGWTAVKITGHDYGPQLLEARPQADAAEIIVWEEMQAGQATDTARYLAAGAHRALLVKRSGPAIPIEQIRASTERDRNIIFESNRIMEVVEPDLCLALVGGSTERKPSFVRLLNKADAMVSLDGLYVDSADLPAEIPRFHLESLDHLSTAMVTWLRMRLDLKS